MKRAPNFSYFMQEFELPSITLPSVQQPTPFTTIRHPGDQIQWEEVSMKFKIQEDLLNYLEIFNWMKGLGYPTTHEEYKAIHDNTADDGKFSDVTVFITTNIKNPNLSVTFHDAFPTSLTGFSLQSTSEEMIYVDSSVRFAYTYFTVEALNV